MIHLPPLGSLVQLFVEDDDYLQHHLLHGVFVKLDLECVGLASTDSDGSFPDLS